jgi:hypothetical protein
MPLLDNIIILIFSLFDWLKGGFLLAIPAFLLVLAGGKLKGFLQGKWKKLSWLQSTLFSTYIITTLLILVLYFGAFQYALQFYVPGPPPPEITPSAEFTLMQSLLFLGVILAKKLFAGLVLSLILLPFQLVGALAYDYLVKRGKKRARKKEALSLPHLFAAVFVVMLAVYALILYFDFILAGVIYLIFNF